MAINFLQTSEPGEYRELVERFSYLVDCELAQLEKESSTLLLANRVVTLISLINSIGYLRGQDGYFLDFRETERGLQKDLYENESAFERRLESLISRVLQSPHAEEYKRELNRYYLENRTIQNPESVETTVL